MLKTLSTLEIRFGKTKVSNAQARKTLDSSLERRTLCRGVKCLFSNGWIKDEDDKVYIYYASSDTRMHIATSNLDQLVDYCVNSPTDQKHSHLSSEKINKLIDLNQDYEYKA